MVKVAYRELPEHQYIHVVTIDNWNARFSAVGGLEICDTVSTRPNHLISGPGYSALKNPDTSVTIEPRVAFTPAEWIEVSDDTPEGVHHIRNLPVFPINQGANDA